MARKRFLNLFIFFILVTLLPSCGKKPSYPENSILGGWMCFEAEPNYRNYPVSIDYINDDSSAIVIYNFYNLGFETETFATMVDTLITISGTSGFNDFTGTGHVERDFSAIHWQFSYFGTTSSTPQVEAVYRRY